MIYETYFHVAFRSDEVLQVSVLLHRCFEVVTVMLITAIFLLRATIIIDGVCNRLSGVT